MAIVNALTFQRRSSICGAICAVFKWDPVRGRMWDICRHPWFGSTQAVADQLQIREFIAEEHEHTDGYVGLILVDLPLGFDSDDLREAIRKQLDSDQVVRQCPVAVVCAAEQLDVAYGAFVGLRTEEEVEHSEPYTVTFISASGQRRDVVVAYVGPDTSKLNPKTVLPHKVMSWPCLEEISPMGSVHCWFHEVVGNRKVDRYQSSVLGAQWLVRHLTSKSDTVLVLCASTGSSVIAAALEGRSSIAVDIKIDHLQRRLRQFKEESLAGLVAGGFIEGRAAGSATHEAAVETVMSRVDASNAATGYIKDELDGPAIKFGFISGREAFRQYLLQQSESQLASTWSHLEGRDLSNQVTAVKIENFPFKQLKEAMAM